MGHRITLNQTCDVVVIGGGIVGSASAYFLAKKGFNVMLLEKNDIASGASGHNAGYIWIHTRKPGPELTLVSETNKMLSKLPEELDYDFELRQIGGMIFFKTEDQAQIMKEFPANGFRLDKEFDKLPWQHMMFFAKAKQAQTDGAGSGASGSAKSE